MYLDPLTKTSVEILAFLSSRIRESFTVRQMAKAIGKDYKITYTMTMRLAEQHYIIAEKKRPVTYCRLNLKSNSSLLAYIEGVRASRFFGKHKEIEVLVNDLKSKISMPFFTMILFGSHVKGKAAPRSDLDVLLIIPDRSFEKEIEAAVGSVQRVSPIGIHETVLTVSEFRELLEQKKPNVAWEAIDNRIVPYGAEMLFKTLEEVL
jgi:hypothetical protein